MKDVKLRARFCRAGCGLLGILVAIGGLGRVLSAQALSICASEPEAWAETMTAQLPGYANREFARVGSLYHVTRVGFPEVNVLGEPEAAQLGVDSTTEEMVQLLFVTSERRQWSWTDGAASTPTLQRHYLAYLARSRQSASDKPWQFISLIAAQPSRAPVAGVPPHSETAGILGRAIRTWQHQGCPNAADFTLERNSVSGDPSNPTSER
ncbi:MAG: hypothetical protein AAFY57_06970 [Cyanobacteria bacterium J06642_2]